MLYKHFPPNLTHVTALPCETDVLNALRCYIMVLNVALFLRVSLAP